MCWHSPQNLYIFGFSLCVFSLINSRNPHYKFYILARIAFLFIPLQPNLQIWPKSPLLNTFVFCPAGYSLRLPVRTAITAGESRHWKGTLKQLKAASTNWSWDLWAMKRSMFFPLQSFFIIVHGRPAFHAISRKSWHKNLLAELYRRTRINFNLTFSYTVILSTSGRPPGDWDFIVVVPFSCLPSLELTLLYGTWKVCHKIFLTLSVISPYKTTFDVCSIIVVVLARFADLIKDAGVTLGEAERGVIPGSTHPHESIGELPLEWSLMTDTWYSQEAWRPYLLAPWRKGEKQGRSLCLDWRGPSWRRRRASVSSPWFLSPMPTISVLLLPPKKENMTLEAF